MFKEYADLKRFCLEVLGKYPEQEKRYKAGETALLGIFMGDAMSQLIGRNLDPKIIRNAFLALLSETPTQIRVSTSQYLRVIDSLPDPKWAYEEHSRYPDNSMGPIIRELSELKTIEYEELEPLDKDVEYKIWRIEFFPERENKHYFWKTNVDLVIVGEDKIFQ